MNITSQIEQDYNVAIDTRSIGHEDSTPAMSPPAIKPANAHPEHPSPTWHAESPSFYTPHSFTASSDGIPYSIDGESNPSPLSNGSRLHLIHSHTSDYSEGLTPQFIPDPQRMTDQITRSPIPTEDAAADLLALRYLPSQVRRPRVDSSSEMPPPGFPSSLSNNQSNLDPHLFDDCDGIFIPGSAYQELHSTLRDHLIYTARSNCPTRDGTPEAQPDMGFFTKGPSHGDSNEETRDSNPMSNHSSKPPELTVQREYILWKTWINEVAPWLDKFDNQRHFEHKIPIIAKTTPHLKNSILALAARQIERKENSASSSESLALYQEAIHLLLPELQSKNTAVIASCVILCVLEMMSCSPKEWRRHLEGCANLLEAVGINGFSGGIDQALFWCFARMDICGALISQDLTLIPIHHWASTIGLNEDIKLFRNPANGFDTYANFAVFLCAISVSFLHELRTRSQGHEPESERSVARWKELFGHLDDWYAQRPEEMKPILTISASDDQAGSPFPTVLYGNGPAVSGNQLYHTAALAMLHERPASVRLTKSQKSIFWHARQICAISESNTHHGAWTNSIQPIWMAGKVMSHPSEHKAILDVLERIERETGWATAWRREDLRNWWGDSDD
ncbi:hypothetical protein BP5796_01353 [Coleophoma crateriformis]|uniref:Transcription factor domain-containing protein n=1 Tax=Coleophoma crateriformis TaxID=565419 RepID=A0A3D8T0D1_9HELO|nr:hypothetical protein BP5796_01353 [Coleophoma crateriformis]